MGEEFNVLTAAELMAALSRMPPDAPVRVYTEGAARVGVRIVYLSQSRDVILCDQGERISSDDDKPVGFPKGAEYTTPGNGGW